MEQNVLVVFMSCTQNSHLWARLLANCPGSLVFCGDPALPQEAVYSNRILKVRCGDTYDFLPNKVHAMISGILKMPAFRSVTHIFKVDDHDTRFDESSISQLQILTFGDYCGQRLNNLFTGNRRWHFGKCPTGSRWENRVYPGPYVPWIDGGCGYILSRKAMQIIAREDAEVIKRDHIFEDVMVALLLKRDGILPQRTGRLIKGDK